jgi:hypothetical protein
LCSIGRYTGTRELVQIQTAFNSSLSAKYFKSAPNRFWRSMIGVIGAALGYSMAGGRDVRFHRQSNVTSFQVLDCGAQRIAWH